MTDPAELNAVAYHRFDDLTRVLHTLANAYPHLLQVDRVGRSHEGRAIWVATVTHFETGSDADKPAFWVDGNIHATELAPSAACLHLIETLVKGHGKDDNITRCLDSRAFYICPRVNPDGAELALADSPRFLRSSTRPWPFDDAPDGLIAEDIDGDGRVLSMRIPDPNGAWKASEEDPRLLVRRGPIEVGGQYYRVLPEGYVRHYDGRNIPMPPVVEGLDLNRQFPSSWRPEGKQKGAGPYPTSEPEVRSIVQFITSHTNIVGAVTFHTFSGVLLRPYSHLADAEMPAQDLRVYKIFGDKGTELTGYPNISVFHDFRYDAKDVITGAFDDWAYEDLGLFSFTVEVWSPRRQAGLKDYKYIEWFSDHPTSDDLQMLRWSDEQLDGQGYIDWYPFEHPELGPVELGGWNRLYSIRNPPADKLQAEVEHFPEWITFQLLSSPRLEWLDIKAQKLGEDTWQLRATVQNTGWLPTYVSKKALETKLVRGVMADIELPEGAALVQGTRRLKLGQLEGRAYKAPTPMWGGDPTDDRAEAEWVVRAAPGTELIITAHHSRAGRVRASVTLGS